MNLSRRQFCCLILLAACLGGCRFQQPKPAQAHVAPVRGRVTLNGKPFVKADVMFESISSRASGGITDSEGRYELTYDGQTKGAFIGQHKVRISRYFNPFEDKGPRPKDVPERYNQKSELLVQVKPGENVFDFDLTEDEPTAPPLDETEGRTIKDDPPVP